MLFIRVPGTLKEVSLKRFPNGEILPSFNIPITLKGKMYPDYRIILDHRNNVKHEEFFALAQIVSAIRNHSLFDNTISLELELPILPYARQDRKTKDGEAISNKVFIEFINSLKFDKVITYDIHSDSSRVLFTDGTLNEKEQDECFISIIKDMGEDILYQVSKDDELFVFVAPDAGALKKAYKVAEKAKEVLNLNNVEVLTAQKHRNTETGLITETSINIPKQFFFGNKRVNFIVVDDICDGGATFIKLAKAINSELDFHNIDETKVKKVLYVTHGLFTKGKEVLKEHYDEVISFH
jgi:ribose-phosphate pyrophosphokinase